MESLARALIYASKHIDNRSTTNIDADADADADADVQVLEEISAELSGASDAEKQCLIRAAKELGFENWPEEMGLL